MIRWVSQSGMLPASRYSNSKEETFLSSVGIAPVLWPGHSNQAIHSHKLGILPELNLRLTHPGLCCVMNLQPTCGPMTPLSGLSPTSPPLDPLQVRGTSIYSLSGRAMLVAHLLERTEGISLLQWWKYIWILQRRSLRCAGLLNEN